MLVISLASGASYFKTPGVAAQRAIEAIETDAITYGETEGMAALREAVVEKYTQLNIKDLLPDQVLVTSGVKQALYNLLQNLLRTPEDEVILPIPSWFGFQELMRYSKGKLVPLHTRLEDNFALTPQMLQQVITKNTRLLLLTNPNNPTGRTYTLQELEALFQVLEKYPEVLVICDEIYDQVAFGKQVPTALASQYLKNRIIVVNGISKSFAMSGWRVGYMVGPLNIIQACTDFQQATISGVSTVLQEAALAALQQADAVLQPMQAVLEANRTLMINSLKQLTEVRLMEPEGSYYIFADFSAYLNHTSPEGTEIKSGTDLWEYLKQKAKVEVQPGENFGAPGFARLSFAVEPDRLLQALQQLSSCLTQLKPLEVTNSRF
ncbi:MAG: aminotransferase class I/II-fold pyridoxal phosphate-dependent enzyme [Hymenobacteraceae bacterium]|nr:aminotransferase class I/II-fold pyridoxal phosphate-dependent enzyme [Hymenobacteraceae bacterium]